MNSYHYLFKYIVIGDMAVGKSSIVLQFLEKKVKNSHDITIGVEFGSTMIEIQGKSLKLQIWDTAGQQNFRSITRSYYRSAIGALLVYDITRKQTFQHVKNWILEVKNNGNPYMEILLVGNKNDLDDQRVVSQAEGSCMAQEYGLKFIEISARDFSKVQKVFLQMSQSILAKVQNEQIPLNQNVGVKAGDIKPTAKLQNKVKNQKKKKCC